MTDSSKVVLFILQCNSFASQLSDVCIPILCLRHYVLMFTLLCFTFTSQYNDVLHHNVMVLTKMFTSVQRRLYQWCFSCVSFTQFSGVCITLQWRLLHGVVVFIIQSKGFASQFDNVCVMQGTVLYRNVLMFSSLNDITSIFQSRNTTLRNKSIILVKITILQTINLTRSKDTKLEDFEPVRRNTCRIM